MFGRTILRWLHLALAVLRRVVDRAIAVVERELPEAPPVVIEPADEPKARTRAPSRRSRPPEHWLRTVRERAPHLLRGEGEGATLQRPVDHVPRPAPPPGDRADTPAEAGGQPRPHPVTEPAVPPVGPRPSSWADAEQYRTRYFRPAPGRRATPPRAAGSGATGAPDGREAALPRRHARYVDASGAEWPTGTRRPEDLEAGASPRARSRRPEAGTEGDDGRVGNEADRDLDVGEATPHLAPGAVRMDSWLRWTPAAHSAGQPVSEEAVATPTASSPALGGRERGDGSPPGHGPTAVASAWPERPPARHAGRAPSPVADEAHDPWPELPPLDAQGEPAARHLHATLDLQRRRERVRREQEGRLWSE